MRRLHGSSRRPGDPLLRDVSVIGRRRQGCDARGPRHAREAASAADIIRGGAGAAVRLLHQRLDHDGRCLPEREEEADRGGDQERARGPEMPLRHPHGHPARRQARRRNDGLREDAMTKFEKPAAFSRRAMLKSGGALVVSIGMPISLDTVLAVSEANAQGAGQFAAAVKPPLTPDQLSSYIAVNADGTVAAFFGKMDMGHGITVAIAQMVAEELDVPFKAVKMHLADTATSVQQGGASGSTGIQLGGKQMRMAAAEARRVLVEMAAERLSVPADQLTVIDGVVHANLDATKNTGAAKKVSYGELIGGRYFNVALQWNKQYGNTLYAPGKAQPKKPSEYKIVGQPIHRDDVAPKVFAKEDFVTDVKLPGMVHARMLRPAVAGSVPVKVDEASIKDIPGARV